MGLRLSIPWSRFGPNCMSSTYVAAPVTFSRPSMRCGLAPMMECLRLEAGGWLLEAGSWKLTPDS